MRKVFVALVAVAAVVVAGGLVAAPKKNGHQASFSSALDILGITQRAQDLPEQAYPAH
jgi:hypothetical protein